MTDMQELLKQGIEAAREGRKDDARQIFEQIIEEDDKNERAWMWLVSVMDNDDERRVALSNVLMINPNNARAQELMSKLDARRKQAKDDQEVIPGITRRQLLMIAGGGAAVIVVVILLFSFISGQQAAQNAAATQVAVDATALSVNATASMEAANAQGTATQMALATSTPTTEPTVERPTLPPEVSLIEPTATPAPSPTPLPFPSNVGGRLATWSGRDVTAIDFLPIVLWSLEGSGTSVELPDSVGREPAFSQDASRLVYTRYFPQTFDYSLALVNADGNNMQTIRPSQPIVRPQMPYFCPTRNVITFVGLPAENSQLDLTADVIPYQLFTLDLDSQLLTRLTNDALSYTYPAFSPDCNQIAVIQNTLTGLETGADLVIIDVASLTSTPLTNDKNAFVETSPRWSPDGRQIAYSAYPENDPMNGDIALRLVSDPNSAPLLVAREIANEIFPVFSPTGQYLAFSSNRSGFYDIYILDLQSNSLLQLTNTEDEDYPYSWVP